VPSTSPLDRWVGNAVPNGSSHWFPAKRYGWGWGPPTTWQGWLVIVLWAAAVFEGLFLLRHNPYRPASNIAFVLIMGGVLTLICYWKGEPPKWRWGDRSE
jgi:lipoprotein signal peptidase